MFVFHHRRADLHFSWDGWMQVKVRAGRSLAGGGFPDRFDIREPDLRDPSRHRMHPADGSVHFVPETQEAFEDLCDTWWRGGEICVGVRDYATDPWRARSWGITVGAFRFRYTGGTQIEISPGEVDAWHPLISLAGDGRTPATLSTVWLMDRVHGWEVAWLAAHGILAPGHQNHDHLHDAIMAWTTARLPVPGPRESLAGQFGAWLYQQVIDEFTGDAWTHQRNLGTPLCYVTPERPVTTTRQCGDGTWWNFSWLGGPYACVWSPDRHLAYTEHYFAERPEVREHGTALRWLDEQADAWLREFEHTGRIPVSALPR